uniref:Clathrin_bdg domain-containing protein n=1 Tax=Anisakis simplex TaxID=6269 RepID=A0A0M3K1A6_ANISI
LCPVDLVAKKFGLLAIDPVRARRQIPNEWSRGRFPPIVRFPLILCEDKWIFAFEELNPVFMQQEQLDDHRRLRLFESTNQINAFPSGSFWPPVIPSAPARFGNLFGQSMDPLSMLSLTVMPPVSLSATVLPLTTAPSTTTVERFKEESDLEGSQESFVTGKPTSLSSYEITTGEREDKALDYYDAIDENFDKAKYEGKGGFLSGVSDLLQNLQDGLTLAQVALPSNKKLVFPTSSTTEGPSFLLSRDDNSLTIGVKNDNDMQKLDSLVKLQGFGPNPARPDGSSNMQTLKTNLGDPGAIQQMLQFFGLCKQEL